VLDHPELVAATGDEMIYFVNRDGRICIFYAVGGKIIAGATDVPTENPEAVCDEAEVNYILEAMRLAFPTIRVDRSHVVFRFCGVRPLPRSDALTPVRSAATTAFRPSRRATELNSRFTLWSAGSGPPSARWRSRWRMRFCAC